MSSIDPTPISQAMPAPFYAAPGPLSLAAAPHTAAAGVVHAFIVSALTPLAATRSAVPSRILRQLLDDER